MSRYVLYIPEGIKKPDIEICERYDYSAELYNRLLREKTAGYIFVSNESDSYKKRQLFQNIRILMKDAEISGAVLVSGDKMFSNGGKPKADSRLRMQKNEENLSVPDSLTGILLNVRAYKSISQSDSSNVEADEPGAVKYTSSNVEMDEPGAVKYTSSNVEMDESGAVKHTSSNTEMDESGAVKHTSSNIEMNEPDTVSDNKLQIGRESGNNASAGGEIRLNIDLEYDMEADFIFRIMSGKIFIDRKVMLITDEPSDIDNKYHERYYDKKWYFENIEGFLIPALKDLKAILDEKEYRTLQFYALYSIRCRLDANKDNRNKHVLSEEEIDEYLDKIKEMLSYIDDDVILNVSKHTMHSTSLYFNRMLLRIKGDISEEYTYSGYNEENELEEFETLHLKMNGIDIYNLSKMRINYLFMDRVMKEDGEHLEIDGTIPDFYDRDKVEIFYNLNGKEYPVKWNDRYTLTKYFGRSSFKRYSFHASIPFERKGKLSFIIRYDGRDNVIVPEYKSHTSRLTNYPKYSYWKTGKYLLRHKKYHISISKYNFVKIFFLEQLIWFQLLKSFNKHKYKFMLLRMGYFVTRPFYKKKHIWMYFDKIYKGGDSAEYLYKYAEKMTASSGKKITNLYLVDGSVPDYKRLKNEGYEPLVRKSIKHRLAFLNAEMMIVSNSTVFAFNDYYMENSRYIRGIVDFHVVCVQHGLSVQKIAVAQNRLRDNTRRYYLASKYEMDNLLRPVYDYDGYDALRLTGVPRYDGLVNNDKKQILISPTWRMQSARAVTKNEGVARDYNTSFKETEYFKVYNSLINNKRLIEAAEKYGYKIKYVLHPIVSPQAADFDTNPYVEIIPSTGDMSYEKLFCESSLMVTDFSGVQFDFAYMRKPLVYLHHEDLDAHYEEGSFIYETMAFGEIAKNSEQLIDILAEYMENGCVMKEMYRKRADDFFMYSDHNNCHRIYEDLMDYYRGNVLK